MTQGLNPYSDDPARASECLRLALSLLSRHQIAPSPLHFRIGYDYVAGTNQELNSALDALTAQPDALNVNSLWDLYRHFFIQDDQALDTMRQELRRVIANIQGECVRSGSGLSEYADTLNRFSQQLDTVISPESLSSQVKQVIAHTRSTEQSQRDLNSGLEQMAAEVEALRKELEAVRVESLTDALTGIANRKAFDKALDNLLREAGEHNNSACLLLIDIDHFKRFNDTHGHLVGDKVLRFVATNLKRSVKGKDIVARFGGEEFVVLLPDTDLAGASIVAEHVRREVSAGTLRDPASGERYGKITISIGVTQFAPGDRVDSLVRRADKALYRAKEQGRNRVEKAA